MFLYYIKKKNLYKIKNKKLKHAFYYKLYYKNNIMDNILHKDYTLLPCNVELNNDNYIIPPIVFGDKKYIFRGTCKHHNTTTVIIKKEHNEYVPLNPVCQTCKISFTQDVVDNSCGCNIL